MIKEFMKRNEVQIYSIYWGLGKSVCVILISYFKWAFEDKDDSDYPQELVIINQKSWECS